MKKLQGVLLSDKMAKTAVVRVERWVINPVYKKRLKRHKKYHAENMIGAKVGDRVVMAQVRPLSKTKRWKIVEIIDKSKIKNQKSK